MYYLIDDHIVDCYFEEQCRGAVKTYYKVNLIDLIGLPNVSRQKVVKALAPETFDWALPVNWVRDVVKVTGEDPGGHFVWGYPEDAPVPVTREGVILLRIYERMKNATV